ncbi:hypothetical protein FIBSPDRAFT_946073 [Athelia psychrophila]|uniref:Ribonuclease H1 N-terminal domain-containing protein n=1 Tax=Athelia psychrophila TaxID=1759441 RepID=A0A166T8J5_9AGAM|nr:hypothetical protein FIBSPDRAFT_946073 [Fibularhizoctonia sp. CBS 109695]
MSSPAILKPRVKQLVHFHSKKCFYLTIKHVVDIQWPGQRQQLLSTSQKKYTKFEFSNKVMEEMWKAEPAEVPNSNSNSNNDTKHEITQLSALISRTCFFVIPDDSADDSKYQEYLAEMTVLRAARKKLRKKVKEGKWKASVGSYTDPEMGVFMAGLPLNEKSEILVPHTLIFQSSEPDSLTTVPSPSTPIPVHQPPSTNTMSSLPPKQGVPSARVKHSNKALTQQRVIKVLYAVFQGLEVGIFESWNDTEPHVLAVNRSTYKAYSSHLCTK